jgi:hypothetical protein
MDPGRIANVLKMFLKNPYVEFFNQTIKSSAVALNLSVKHDICRRDALITANFIANKIPALYTHDKQLLKLQKITLIVKIN